MVGVAAVVLLATTKSGQELLSRIAERVLLPEPQEPEEDAKADESEVTDLKPRDQLPRKAPAPPKASNA